MGWYKPGRNPNHPGDPPPKWAPLSTRSRLALLVAVIAGVVIALMVISTRSAGAADGTGGAATVTGPSSPAESSQRVEVREAGNVVAFPEDWVAAMAAQAAGPSSP